MSKPEFRMYAIDFFEEGKMKHAGTAQGDFVWNGCIGYETAKRHCDRLNQESIGLTLNWDGVKYVKRTYVVIDYYTSEEINKEL